MLDITQQEKNIDKKDEDTFVHRIEFAQHEIVDLALVVRGFMTGQPGMTDSSGTVYRSADDFLRMTESMIRYTRQTAQDAHNNA